MTRIAYINPNSTRAMTENIVTAARAALPEAEIVGYTNADGPPAIQGEADGRASVPGLIALIPAAIAAGAQAIVIACFDDTGLAEARVAASCPVLGVGQASYLMAATLGRRFSVVTSLPVSVPVIEGNIRAQGFARQCASVRASGLPVLEIDSGSEPVRSHLAREILAARDKDGAEAVVLGCAGMAALALDLTARTGTTLIDGVAASAQLARAAIDFTQPARETESRPSGSPDAPTDIEDPIAAAKRVVETYLELSMIPDPQGAARYTAPDLTLIFTGGRRFSSPADSAAFNGKRYRWVKKRFLRTDATLDAATGEVRVYNTGFLYGEWPDGTPFESNRYIDIFTVKDGRITETHVWNDSAEILLSHAGLAEAPL